MIAETSNAIHEVGEDPQGTAPRVLPAQISATVNALVGDRLVAIEKQIACASRSRYPEVTQLCSQAASMGGKRLRPVLTILSAQASATHVFSNRQERDLVYVGTAVELVHAASLVHDDVMDGAAERRHKPTIGTISGNSQAILLGDFLFTRAYESAACCRSGFAARKLAKAATQLCEGELRQQVNAGNWALEIPEYLSLLAQKTGALCGISCLLGVWAAGGMAKHAKCLYRFGNQLGIAFQIFDDWLDYWGAADVGKTLGTDLAQQKPTLPTLRLLQTTSPQEKRNLLELLSAGGASREQELRQLLDQSDAAEFTLQAARRHVSHAVAALQDIPDSPSKECLERLAEFSVARIA